MNKTLLAIVMAAVGIAGVASQQAIASDGQLNFTGLVSDISCSVTGGIGTDGGVKNISVPLDTVSEAALTTNGMTAGDHPFTLIIGGAGQTGCTDGSKVSVHFDANIIPAGFASAMVDPVSGNLKNQTGAGYATNVQVGLVNPNGWPMNFSTSDGVPEATIENGTATLNYVARYVATGGAATAGDVKTAVIYSLVYN